MTKKAKTKTKSDEAPPKSAPSEKQNTEPGAGPGADTATPPQPPTPAATGPTPQLSAAAQPEAAKAQDSPTAATPIATPALPDTEGGKSKATEPPTPIPQAPAQLGVVDSPPEKSSAAQAPAQLEFVGSSPGNHLTTQAPAQLGAVSPTPETPSTTQAPAQLAAMSPTLEKPSAAQVHVQLGAVGSTPEIPSTAQATAQLGTVGPPAEKPPTPKQENASNTAPKPCAPVQSEPPKGQSIAPHPNSQILPQPPASNPSLSTTSTEKMSEAPKDISLAEKESKPLAQPKTQNSGRDLADKNQKVSSTTPKAAPIGPPSKKPAEKQNKRQAPKDSIPSNSILNGGPNVNKPAEIDIKQSSHSKVIEKPESSSKAETAKDTIGQKVEEVASTQVKVEPNKHQVDAQKSEPLAKQNSAREASKKTRDAEPSKPKETNKNIATATTENLKLSEKPETSKDPTADGKVVEQKVDPDPATQGNQQKPPSTKSDPGEKPNKNTAPKKNKQKNETSASKTEGPPKSKEAKPVDKGGKKDTTTAATIAQPLSKVSEADSSKTSSSNKLPDTVPNVPTPEAVASSHSAQAREDGNKMNQQAKVTPDSKDVKESSIKDDAQSKSSGKKKNRQQKKSVSEDVKPLEENDNKGTQEVPKSKNNEKKKPASVPPSTEKESRRTAASAEKTKKKVPSESVTPGAKVGKSPTVEKTSPVPTAANNSQLKTAKNDSSDKTQVISSESQLEEEAASKKKKRNRHKKKNKVGDGDTSTDASAEVGKQQDPNVTAVGGERKAKEKQQTTTPQSNKSKGQQKDSQPGQANVTKGTQPVCMTQDVQLSSETPTTKQASEATAQTASAKKRNRRKKKGTSAIEKDSDDSLLQESKSAESKETPVAKTEEQKAKVITPPTQTKADESQKKKADSKPTPKLEKPQQQDGQFIEGTEDQSENFVEVVSKNKRNKKKKLDSAEPKEDGAIFSSNNVSKVVPESIVDASVSSYKGKTETENVGVDSAKGTTNKVAAPKISQEAREQKMLNKKLAERAQLKIQKQIESNALSEVEKSEKYLETITKNLRELTKLRSSRLEDVLQKPGDEEFDYEYTPVQRNTFLATTCHVCKESKPREAMRICEQCHLLSYCSEEHQKSDWSAHKDLCQAISEMCKERGTDDLYAPAVGLSAEEYRGYRMNALLECSAILNRQLEPYEQEIILYPNVCHTCHLASAASLHTCESCSMVSYCSPEHRPPNHDVWCHDLQLYKSLIIYQSRNGVINPQLPVFLPESFQPPNGDMQSHLRTLSGGVDASPLERAVLSEIATGPLTALFALQKSNKVSGTTEKVVIHFVGAEWSFEMERADKWEAFLLHLIPSLKALVLVFVGPEVCNLPPEARGLLQNQSRPCLQCQEKGRTVEMVIAPQSFYHEYVASQEYIPPTIICAYNAGLYRPNGHKEIDSWADTVQALLKDPAVPVAVTSYTAEEVLKDAERLQHHGQLNFVLPPSQNPYRSLRPNRNFASDDVTPVIFKNYYIMIATSLTQ